MFLSKMKLFMNELYMYFETGIDTKMEVNVEINEPKKFINGRTAPRFQPFTKKNKIEKIIGISNITLNKLFKSSSILYEFYN